MTNKKFGIELGIKAPMDAIYKAATIAESSEIDYFFIPETNPNVIGVNAFDAISILANIINRVTLGTGIVNIFSRHPEQILEISQKIYQKTNQKFVLGLGTSAPAIIEKMYNMTFEKPVSRILQYTKYLKANYQGPIFWSAVGEKMTKLAAEHADGVIFFLKPTQEIEKSIKIIEDKLNELGRNHDSFEIVVIRPTFLNSSIQTAKKSAQMTIASYVNANEFYANPLKNSGFEDEVQGITQNFKSGGLHVASEQVSEKMISELATFGTANDCKRKLNQCYSNLQINTIISGFDLPKDGYNEEFFDNLSELIR